MIANEPIIIRFSILITTHNRLSLLKRAIQSALSQTVPCEIIISDDGSTDGTQEYIKSLGDRVVYHRTDIAQGQSAAVNAGIQLAQGDWIKLLDDDDYLKENCLEFLSRGIAANSNIVLCSCQTIQVTASQKILGTTPRVGTTKFCYIKQEDIHYGMLLEVLPIGTTTQVAFKRESILKTSGWDAQFDGYGNDINFWIEIVRSGDCLFVNEVLAYRTVWSSNYSGQYPLMKRFENSCLIKRKLFNYMPKKYWDIIPKEDTIQAFLSLYWGFYGLIKANISTGLHLLYPALFSWKGWQHLVYFLWIRKIIGTKYLNIYNPLLLP